MNNFLTSEQVAEKLNISNDPEHYQELLSWVRESHNTVADGEGIYIDPKYLGPGAVGTPLTSLFLKTLGGWTEVTLEETLARKRSMEAKF